LKRVLRIAVFVLIVGVAAYFRSGGNFGKRATSNDVVGVWENTDGDVSTTLTINSNGQFFRTHPGVSADQVMFAQIPPKGTWALDETGTINFRDENQTTAASFEPRGGGTGNLTLKSPRSDKYVRFRHK
jgi:hypothetical protein